MTTEEPTAEEPKTVTVTNNGPDEYASVDPETGQSVRLEPGESAEVSEAKAKQLHEDFPDWFGGAAKASPKRSAAKKS